MAARAGSLLLFVLGVAGGLAGVAAQAPGGRQDSEHDNGYRGPDPGH